MDETDTPDRIELPDTAQRLRQQMERLQKQFQTFLQGWAEGKEIALSEYQLQDGALVRVEE
jgi:hypothetical protein